VHIFSKPRYRGGQSHDLRKRTRELFDGFNQRRALHGLLPRFTPRPNPAEPGSYHSGLPLDRAPARATSGFAIAIVVSLIIAAVVFAFVNPGAALCVGVILLAWIGKKWLDYRDALVEQEAHIRQQAEEIRREQQDWAARQRLWAEQNFTEELETRLRRDGYYLPPKE